MIHKKQWLKDNKEHIICEPSGWKWMDRLDQEQITRVCFMNEEQKELFINWQFADEHMELQQLSDYINNIRQDKK